MNYIYDIYLNLNDVLYDFFDWNKNDKLIHIKKIPIFKINEDNFRNIMHNSIKFDDNFVNCVKGRTEVWNMSQKLDFCALFSDNNNIIAVETNEFGNSIKKSFLQIDEELEVLDTINKIKEKEINFEIIKEVASMLKTRKQLKEENFIDKELKNIDNEKLRYIYFECFGKHEKNRKVILNSIKGLSRNSKTYKNLYNILKLTSEVKNNMV